MSDDMAGCQVLDEHVCRMRYPGVSERHELLYPGCLVPLWAIAMVSAFDHAGHFTFVKRLNFTLARIREDSKRAEIVRVCLSLAALAPGYPQPPECSLPESVTRVVEAYLLAHGCGSMSDDEPNWAEAKPPLTVISQSTR